MVIFGMMVMIMIGCMPCLTNGTTPVVRTTIVCIACAAIGFVSDRVHHLLMYTPCGPSKVLQSSIRLFGHVTPTIVGILSMQTGSGAVRDSAREEKTKHAARNSIPIASCIETKVADLSRKSVVKP